MKELKLYISKTQAQAIIKIMESYLNEYIRTNMPNHHRINSIEEFIETVKRLTTDK